MEADVTNAGERSASVWSLILLVACWLLFLINTVPLCFSHVLLRRDTFFTQMFHPVCGIASSLIVKWFHV